jgi:hypothetical protein
MGFSLLSIKSDKWKSSKNSKSPFRTLERTALVYAQRFSISNSLICETNILQWDRERDFFRNLHMDESGTETFLKTKVERDQDETESLML